MDLRQIDLNLLLSLDALLAECNVTRAARRLHLSQPALSGQLARLRQIFNDPLLLPAETGRGMTPTARALALGPALHSVLKDLEAVVQYRPSFDPLTDERSFQIAVNDTAMVVLGLPLIERLATEAGPGVRVAFRNPAAETIAAQMEGGEVDLLIASERLLPASMKMRPLVHGRFVMAQRKRHPRGTGPLDVEAYSALRHVLVTEFAGRFTGYIDEALAERGYHRQVVVSVEKFSLVPEILRHSDYVCTLPSMLMGRFSHALDMFDLPFDDRGFGLQLGWHPRNHADPAVSWLRNLVLGLVEEGAGGAASAIRTQQGV
ncbi:LysR family transcriptional regulator [Zoogloea dura]|uniref:LysR family transcriptional regulator n=1 Tax=Zoogloea dura TaxID=2728840 RepID=A0A848G5J5_9RHOO|nr:LysR family transcriptional regulator [Zoogloea dura]NML26215.1 LysR family transcriptional regulator [Zoogloea dura]